MLNLSRRVGERICIGEDVEVVVVKLRGNYVTLGIEAPRDTRIDRKEVRKKKDRGEKGREET